MNRNRLVPERAEMLLFINLTILTWQMLINTLVCNKLIYTMTCVI